MCVCVCLCVCVCVGGGGGKKRRGEGQFNRMRRGKKRDKGLEVNNREEGMNQSRAGNVRILTTLGC